MSQDNFTEVTSQSWFGRIKSAFGGIIVGFLMFVVAFPLLFWNEGRAVRTYKTLAEGGKAVMSVSSDRVDPANAGKLVHVTGKAVTSDKLADPVFGVSANAVQLKRTVEMYQWKESVQSKTRKKLGGGQETEKTYNYSKEWSDGAIDSSRFKVPAGHENPGTMPYASEEWAAAKVTVGSYRLPDALVRMIDNFTPLSVESGTSVPAALGAKAKAHAGGYYIGENPAAPAVGDVKITFKAVTPSEVSVIAAQAGDTFEPYRAKAGGTIQMLEVGVRSADAMIKSAQASNTTLTWILRGVGFFVMFIGLSMIFKPLSVLADVIPFVGSLVGAGTGIVAFLISAVLSLITVSVAWIVYRPLVGIVMMVLALGGVFLLFKKLRQGKAAAPASPGPPM